MEENKSVAVKILEFKGKVTITREMYLTPGGFYLNLVETQI